MVQLVFESSARALDYVENFFSHNVIAPNKTYYGVIQFIDRSGTHDIFMVEIVALKKSLFSSKVKRVLVGAHKHPDLPVNIDEGDLVVWGCLEKKSTFSIGVIVHRCELKMDEENKNFVISDLHIFRKKPHSAEILKTEIDSKKEVEEDELKERHLFKVFVDDNFHYMDESERYQQGEYETEEEAIKVCRKIVDDYLLNAYEPDMTAEKLYESYVSFGEDPFIQGVSFSAWDYAKIRSKVLAPSANKSNAKKYSGAKNLRKDSSDLAVSANQPQIKQSPNKESVEKKPSNLSPSQVVRSINQGVEAWVGDIDFKYGKILENSEILEDQKVIYVCSGTNNKMVAGWDLEAMRWIVNVKRGSIDKVPFSTPARFQNIVFGRMERDEGYVQKQFLNEYLLLGLPDGEKKDLMSDLSNKKVKFSIPAREWNELLIGDHVALEGLCRLVEEDTGVESSAHFTFLCSEWNASIEVGLRMGHYEQYQCTMKQFGGYYN